MFHSFDHVIKADGRKVIKTPIQSPKCNAFSERFVREARETLNKMIPLGERHFRHILKSIEVHHNNERPHQGIGNVIPLPYDYPNSPAEDKQIQYRASLGGLLKHYYAEKKAA